MTALRLRLRPFLFALLACVALLANPTPAEAQKPTVSHPPDWRRLWVPRRALEARGVRAPVASARTVVTESEPNDSVYQADPVVLGDTASGIIDTLGDIDFYALDITAGIAVSLDVVASRVGSNLDAILVLFDVDSVTVLAFNDDFNGFDSHINFTIPATGRYFVAIAGFDGSGDPGSFYSLTFGVSPPGPGDPTTLYSAAAGGSWGIAAGGTGELYVADINGSIQRVSAAGAVTTFANFFSPVGVVIDGFGNLLVAGQDSSLRLAIRRYSPAGQPSAFGVPFDTNPCCIVVPITVAPNGDVWVGNNVPTPSEIRHYDSQGNLKNVVPIDDIILDLAFSPAGVLHFSNGDAVFKLVNNTPQLVVLSPPVVDGFAFDRDGYLYVTSGLFSPQVQLFDPAGVPVDTPFARTNMSGRLHLAFLRDANGAMTSRLLASNVEFDGVSFVGSIVEMNPAGVRAPGLRIGGDLLQVANTSLRAGVVGADYADTLRIVAPPGPVTWSVVSGTLPPGITLAAATGVLSGIPAQDGAFPVSVRGDAASKSGFGSFTITVTEPTVVVQAAATHLLGGTPVDSVQQRFLDLQGNQNGKFDIGDFRAYLRATGQLPLLQALIRKEQP